MTYVCQATSWLAIQPDLQYVWHPGAVPGLHNAAVVQVEFETSF
jgi:carbohydrate-selective porin OprB